MIKCIDLSYKKPPFISQKQPYLILPICPPGGGKSTFCNIHFSPKQIINGDEYREKLTDDINEQSANRIVFNISEVILRERLKRRLTTVIDNTNIKQDVRKKWLTILNEEMIPFERNDVKSCAIYFDVTYNQCIQQNKQRNRQVPEPIIKSFYEEYLNIKASSLLYDEGFDSVYIFNPNSNILTF